MYNKIQEVTLFSFCNSKTEIGDIDDLVHLAQYTMSDSSLAVPNTVITYCYELVLLWCCRMVPQRRLQLYYCHAVWKRRYLLLFRRMALKEATTYIISMANFSFLSLSALWNVIILNVMMKFWLHTTNRNGNEIVYIVLLMWCSVTNFLKI